MKKIVLLFSLILFTIAGAFADSTTVAKYNKKKISLKKIEKLTKSNKTLKEVSGTEFIVLENGTMVNLILKKFVDKNNVALKGSIDYMYGEGFLREIFYFNKDGVLIKAISEEYRYQGNDKFELANQYTIAFVNYRSLMFFVNGQQAYPSQEEVDVIVNEIQQSITLLSGYFNK